MWYAKWNKTLKHIKCGKQSQIAKQEIQHVALILIQATSAVPQLMENGKQGKLRKGFHQILSHLHTDELWRTLPNAGVNPSSISSHVKLKEKANFWGKSIFWVGKTNYGLADSSLGGEGNPFNKTVKTSSTATSTKLKAEIALFSIDPATHPHIREVYLDNLT